MTKMNNFYQQRSHLFRAVFLAVMLVGCLLLLPSCSDNEPELRVDYYLSIDSEESFMASNEDESQGTMSDADHGNVLYTTITRMKTALRDAYPVPDYQGADAAVLTACDKIYRNYKGMYGQFEKNTICVVKLKRVRLEDNVAVSSRTLTTYSFGALPPGMDHSDAE